MSKSLEALRKLTPMLPALVLPLPSGNLSYKMDAGECVTRSLLNNGNVAVAHTVFSEGAIFPLHIHDIEFEIIVIISGSLRWEVGEEEFHLSPGSYGYVHPGVAHSAVADVETEIIAITVPAAGGYPK